MRQPNFDLQRSHDIDTDCRSESSKKKKKKKGNWLNSMQVTSNPNILQHKHMKTNIYSNPKNAFFQGLEE